LQKSFPLFIAFSDERPVLHDGRCFLPEINHPKRGAKVGKEILKTKSFFQ
jgi:hypothetical protein